ncbi:hypothetical protein GIB67_037431 [Kingdonia uniflora]|uniref:Uncharacterized protein n=1 Tax=Kingdonia uniflora TaxID=39325 RepID=A0A7J7LY84_9MAGN|nr:hypothetical protein GIB67_037431 [Kingdonia uniflora]
MDTKSLAKSKRAHSQHLKRTHTNPNQKLKPKPTPTPLDQTKNKSSSKQTQPLEKPHLPSNWDRYDEPEPEFGSTSSNAAAADVVEPKSKGADFAQLVSEAQSHLGPNSDNYISFEDAIPDIDRGICSMLAIRGNNILSWISDESFVVDDESATWFQASFISVDLHVLAAQLTKIDVPRRLFIEADILPPELCSDESKETINQEYTLEESSTSGPAKYCTEKSHVLQNVDLERNIDRKSMVTQSELVDQGSRSDIPVLSYGGARRVNPIQDNPKKLYETDLGEVIDSIGQLDVNTSTDSKEGTSAFQASVAEADLDMLLNSLGDSKNPMKTLQNSQCDNLPSFIEGLSTVSSSKVSNYLRDAPITTNLDETIDDLLVQTSDVRNQKQGLLRAEEFETPSDIPVMPSKSAIELALDDFDSWLDTI